MGPRPSGPQLQHHASTGEVSNYYRIYTVLRLRGRTPDAGSDPPFAPQCKRKSPSPIAGSDPPFVLLQICRVRPRMRGLTPLFVCVCVNRKLVLPPQCMELFHV